MERNGNLTRAILRSYARNISTLAKSSSILADITASGEISVSKPTFEDYVETLKRLFIIDNIYACGSSAFGSSAFG